MRVVAATRGLGANANFRSAICGYRSMCLKFLVCAGMVSMSIPAYSLGPVGKGHLIHKECVARPDIEVELPALPPTFVVGSSEEELLGSYFTSVGTFMLTHGFDLCGKEEQSRLASPSMNVQTSLLFGLPDRTIVFKPKSAEKAEEILQGVEIFRGGLVDSGPSIGVDKIFVCVVPRDIESEQGMGKVQSNVTLRIGGIDGKSKPVIIGSDRIDSAAFVKKLIEGTKAIYTVKAIPEIIGCAAKACLKKSTDGYVGYRQEFLGFDHATVLKATYGNIPGMFSDDVARGMNSLVARIDALNRTNPDAYVKECRSIVRNLELNAQRWREQNIQTSKSLNEQIKANPVLTDESSSRIRRANGVLLDYSERAVGGISLNISKFEEIVSCFLM